MDIGELELRIPTVSEINEHMVEFTKEYVKLKIAEILTEISADENLPRDKLMLYIRKINFDDISSTVNTVKRPRKKIDSKDRCKAKTSKGDQCTRKRRDDMLYCGSHETSRPYGEVDDVGPSPDPSRSSSPSPKTKTQSRSKPIIKMKQPKPDPSLP